jgi:hypothetical protein
MLTDKIIMISGAEIINAHVESGTTFPISPSTGQIFYLTTSIDGNDIGLYSYNGTSWIHGAAGTITSISGDGGTTGLTLSGGPITTSGTLTIGGTLAIANGGTGLSTIGTAYQILRTNSGATALEWANMPSNPYDVGAFYNGNPSGDTVICLHVFNRSATFPIDFTGSHGISLNAATAQTTFSIYKNNTLIGNMVFAISATTATFTAASETTFIIGDILKVVAPTTPDITLSDITFLLAGIR